MGFLLVERLCVVTKALVAGIMPSLRFLVDHLLSVFQCQMRCYQCAGFAYAFSPCFVVASGVIS